MTSLLSYVLSVLKKRPPPRPSKHNLPQPRVCHLELGADVIRDRKVFVIGDVHGCYDELCELIDKAEQREPNILCVFVGDLINKGPKSKEVLELVQSMECYSVRGNHDDVVLHEYYKSIGDPNYAMKEKNKWIKDLPWTDFEYLKDLPYTISIPSLNATIVHAGLIPGWGFEGQDFIAMTHMRNIEQFYTIFHGSCPILIPSESSNDGVPWASLWPGPDHVYFGHDAVRGLQTYPYDTGLDTGCVYGKSLTGIFLDGTREFISVTSKQPDMFKKAD
ncbi:bis(5'-nucleosyl)-tetraphosphatase PrpE [asymmetrical]-like [Haliotis rubra]|uniref:bis(5'-nucleosyl)-tetraphosphatase PrpE [asymmetrical]-like n=1 Tax=Haliotis rubra TaxID=36100 RepID=UPI001EE56B76|nr:bis(5'-nucleosyl)-tetraphosphatase PrpE [asymmetrical]-like [Haliotis rubra]XP_046552060.1 bis(5'-nucleosyl)-tetraphosphatase PrpE [asymmetrical]-like [Haliotis rubra]